MISQPFYPFSSINYPFPMLTNLRQKNALLCSHFEISSTFRCYCVKISRALDAEAMIVELLETSLPWWKNSISNFQKYITAQQTHHQQQLQQLENFLLWNLLQFYNQFNQCLGSSHFIVWNIVEKLQLLTCVAFHMYNNKLIRRNTKKGLKYSLFYIHMMQYSSRVT